MARKKKMRLCASVQKTFEEGFQEFILDCKSRNLRQGTIIHYEVAIKQGPVAKFKNESIDLVGAIINRPRALNERPYVHRT